MSFQAPAKATAALYNLNFVVFSILCGRLLVSALLLPDKNGYQPNYGDYRFAFDDRKNKWLSIATRTENKESQAPIRIHADINAFAAMLDKGNSIDMRVEKGRQAYLVLIEGQADINGIELNERDALEIVEENITIKALRPAHILVIEMARG